MFTLRHGKYHGSGINVVDSHPGLGVSEAVVGGFTCLLVICVGTSATEADVNGAEVHDFR